MSYSFIKFENRNARVEQRITITRSNSIGFPTGFYESNRLKNFKYVVLFWDSDKKAIGIHFTNNEAEKNHFSIIHSEKYGGSVVARSFFKILKIDPNLYYGRYEWTKEVVPAVGEVFVVDLKERDVSG